jgi:zinc transport system permease protein
LVLPAQIGRLFSLKPFQVLIYGWIIGVAASIAGILLSYFLDLPTGPVIVAGMALSFFVLLASKVLHQKYMGGRGSELGTTKTSESG